MVLQDRGGFAGFWLPGLEEGGGTGTRDRGWDGDGAVGRAGRWHPLGVSGTGGGAACLQNCACHHVGHRAGNDRAAAPAPTAPGRPPRGARLGGDTQGRLGAHPAHGGPRQSGRARRPRALCVCDAHSPCSGYMSSAWHPHVLHTGAASSLRGWCVLAAHRVLAVWPLYDLRVFASRLARALRACCALSCTLAARLHAHCTLAACLHAHCTLRACLLHPPSVLAAHTPHPLLAPCTLPAFFARSRRTRRTLSARCLPHRIPSPKGPDPGGVGAMAGG